MHIKATKAMEISQFLWRPFGYTDAEILKQWPYCYQKSLTRPIGYKCSERMIRMDIARETTIPVDVRPMVIRAANSILKYIEINKIVPMLQARLKRLHRRHEHLQAVAVLMAIHPRLGGQSLLGTMLGQDMLQLVVQRLV